MSYTLRARNYRTLTYKGKEYQDGDSIPISKSEAEKIALDFPAYRFEGSSGEISMDSIDAATAPATVAPEPTKRA